jgi:hypothetical protein
VIFAAYEATIKRYDSFSLENSPYFLAFCAGPYVVSALMVLIYYLVRQTKLETRAQLLILCSGASLIAVLSVINTSHAAYPIPSKTVSDRQLAASPEQANPQPQHSPTIWDPAIISLYTDLRVHNEAYVAAVSHLDVGAEPLYLPGSFRDASTIQKVLEQLDARLAVADQFSSLDPILARMPGYVAAIDAGEADKRAFMASFMPAAEQNAAKRKVASAYEHDWLRATIALYQFMLANQAAYTISPDGKSGRFRSHASSVEFDQRLRKAQQLKQQFLNAHYAYLAGQSAARAQAGMPD